MQFVMRLYIENAVVRILADHAMQLLPLALPLQVLRIGLLARLDFFGLSAGMSCGR